MAKRAKKTTTAPHGSHMIVDPTPMLAGSRVVFPTTKILDGRRVVFTQAHDGAGGPGRPGSKRLVKEEAERRAAAGTVPRLLKVFASDLSVWLRENYPNAPQMEPDAIKNVIRKIWRRAETI